MFDHELVSDAGRWIGTFIRKIPHKGNCQKAGVLVVRACPQSFPEVSDFGVKSFVTIGFIGCIEVDFAMS